MRRIASSRHIAATGGAASLARVDCLRTRAGAPCRLSNSGPVEIQCQTRCDDVTAISKEHNAVRPELPLPPEELTRMPVSIVPGAKLRVADALSTTSDQLASFSFECHACHATVDGPMRLVCPLCLAVRPNAPGLLKALLAQNRGGNIWYCARCHEVNLGSAARCRCCSRPRVGSTTDGTDGRSETSSSSSSAAGRVPPPQPVALPESLRRLFINPQRALNGEVFRHRDCFLRWRCPSCSTSNAHWELVCRECSTNRLKSTPGICPTCRSQTHTLEDAVLKKACRGCHGSLHGMASPSMPHSWLCTCATVSHGQTCLRCRAPKMFPQTPPTALLRHTTAAHHGILDGGGEEALRGPSAGRGCGDSSQLGRGAAWVWLQRWDFLDGTHWLCASCFEINLASRKIAVGDSNTSRRTTRSVAGQHSCSSCGVLWHGALVDGGASWRCACHTLNPTSRESCSDCGLPFKLGSVTAISTWMPRDWLCALCGHHNYKSRVECSRCKHPRGRGQH